MQSKSVGLHMNDSSLNNRFKLIIQYVAAMLSQFIADLPIHAKSLKQRFLPRMQSWMLPILSARFSSPVLDIIASTDTS